MEEEGEAGACVPPWRRRRGGEEEEADEKKDEGIRGVRLRR